MRLCTPNIVDIMAVTQEREPVQFREIGGNALHIADHAADHAKSMKILADNGLRPLTYQEALSRSSELITELKGKWFYLDGQGTEKSGIYTFNNKGELVESTGKESIDQKVRVWSGNQPLLLCVAPNYVAWDEDERFDLVGSFSPDDVAPVVVGVKGAQAGSVAATAQSNPISKQVVKAARREYESQVIKNGAIDTNGFPAYKELLEAVEAAQHQ